MRYELYGIGKDGEFAFPMGAYQSRKLALKEVSTKLKKEAFPHFIILEKIGKNQAPVGCELGDSGTSKLIRSSSFVTGENPVRDQKALKKYLNGNKQR